MRQGRAVLLSARSPGEGGGLQAGPEAVRTHPGCHQAGPVASGGENMTLKFSEEEATEFFAEFYRGEHHFPSKIKKFGEGWAMSHFGAMATFDFDELSRLVFLAHDRCIRVQIEQGGPNRIRIAIWRRVREGDRYNRHPTLEQAIEGFRRQCGGDRRETQGLYRLTTK